MQAQRLEPRSAQRWDAGWAPSGGQLEGMMRLQGQWLDSPSAATTGPESVRQLWAAASVGCWASTKATRLELQWEQTSAELWARCWASESGLRWEHWSPIEDGVSSLHVPKATATVR